MLKSYEEIAPLLKELRNKHVVTERDEKLERHLKRLFDVDDNGKLSHVPARSADNSETRGVILIEGSGGGKTTAIRKSLKSFEALAENPETGLPRYIEVRVESPATMKSLAKNILGELGTGEISDRVRVWQMWDLVRHRMHRQGISVLWLDEAQDMFLGGVKAETNDMFKTLKGLMQGKYAVNVILSGTERLSKIASLDQQISRRFSKIQPAALEVGADAEYLEELIGHYAGEAGLKVSFRDSLIGRLIVASRARFGRLIYFTIGAIECALQDGAKVLDVERYADIWEIEEGGDYSDNIFVRDDWGVVCLDAEAGNAEEFESQQPTRRSRKRAAA